MQCNAVKWKWAARRGQLHQAREPNDIMAQLISEMKNKCPWKHFWPPFWQKQSKDFLAFITQTITQKYIYQVSNAVIETGDRVDISWISISHPRDRLENIQSVGHTLPYKICQFLKKNHNGIVKCGLISKNAGELLPLQQIMTNLYPKLLHRVHGIWLDPTFHLQKIGFSHHVSQNTYILLQAITLMIKRNVYWLLFIYALEDKLFLVRR